MLIVMGHMHVAPADLTQFIADLDQLAFATRRRKGNISYDAGVVDSQSGSLIISERWDDQSALNAHLEASETEQFIKRWQGRMRGDVRKYDGLNERGLLED